MKRSMGQTQNGNSSINTSLRVTMMRQITSEKIMNLRKQWLAILVAACFVTGLAFSDQPTQDSDNSEKLSTTNNAPSSTGGTTNKIENTSIQKLDEVVVIATSLADSRAVAVSPSTGDLLQWSPGVSLQQNGGLATLPIIHGLADERVKVLVDGMTLSSACPNHMNPATSYIDPKSVAKTDVLAGITPVSLGGDSLGGTVSIESAPPVFATGSERIHTEGFLNTYYGSDNKAYGIHLSSEVADKNLSLGYDGSYNEASDYHDGHGNKVTSTYYKNDNHILALGLQNPGNLLVLSAGFSQTPKEGFVNEQMDLVRNNSVFLNALYKKDFDWGTLNSRVYWQNIAHEMNIGDDKVTFPMPMWMPMDTHAVNVGYSLKAEIKASDEQTVRVGNEFHRFELNDTWPAVPGTDPFMAPWTFININNGERNRIGTYLELESKWTPEWTTLLGVRNDTVWMDTGNVHGYSSDMMYSTDAAQFNSQQHDKTDINWDLTALTRLEPNKWSTYELGYARKTRSPSLYERYAWATDYMTSGMINWFGDGNYYVGNLNLKPEVANTVSVTANWHDDEKKKWELAVTPYCTYVEDYIDVDQLGTVTYGASTFSQLQFANHDAQFYGLDLSGKAQLWEKDDFGTGTIRATAGWERGERIASSENIYHIMPLHARIELEESWHQWTAATEVELVDSKTQVDDLRHEPQTAGYALLNLKTGYQWKYVRLDAGIKNLFDTYYQLPLGGVNFDDYMATGWMGSIQALAGEGRTLYTSLTVKF